MNAFVAVTAILISGIYLWGQFNQGALFSLITNIITPLVALAPASFSVFVLTKYGFKPAGKFGRVWPSISAGLCLWFLGDLSWSVYFLVLAVRFPYPSLADAFWLAGYPFLIFSMFSYVGLFKERLSAKSIAIASLVAVVVAAIIAAVLVEPVFSLSAEPSTQVFDMAYPILDVVLLAVSVVGLLLFLPGGFGRFWAIIAVGFISEVLGDVTFSYTTAVGTYYDGHPLELFFLFGYLTILLGLYQHTLTF